MEDITLTRKKKRSAVREPVLFDSSAYGTVFRDLEASFGVGRASSAAAAADVWAGSGRARPAVYCASVAELEEARLDGTPLRLPRRVLRQAERLYGGGAFGFWALCFSQRAAVSRLHLSFSHPLMRGRLYLPRALLGPRGVPFGERDDVCIDEDPAWARDWLRVYAANASHAVLEEAQPLEAHQQQLPPGAPAVLGLALASLPARLAGGPPAVLLRGRLGHGEDVWAPLARAFVGLQRAASSVASGNARAALRTFEALAAGAPCSAVLARFAIFCAAQGDHRGAVELCREAAACNGRNPLVYVLFAQCLASDPARAARAFRRALELDPYDSRALAGLALCLSERGYDAFPEARALLARALLLDPADEAASARLASLSEPPSALGLCRADAIKLAERAEEKETVEHLKSFINYLDYERQALFPGPL